MKKILLIIALILTSTSVLKCNWGGFGSIVSIDSIDNLNGSMVTITSRIDLISGDPQVTQKGLVWSTSPNPTLTSNLGKTQDGAGGGSGPRTETFQSVIYNLTLGTTYYIRPYAINNDGTYLGTQIIITTNPIPTLPEWGLIALGSLFAMFGVWYVWRRVV